MTTPDNSSNKANPLDKTLARKPWRKPVLDILELEAAEHGKTHLTDGGFSHRSY
jgi:hypothetical protein